MRPARLRAAVAALALLTALGMSTPAFAGDTENARLAIAAAQAKVDAAGRVQAGPDSVDAQAQARSALTAAIVALDNHKARVALTQAQNASRFADLALASSNRAKSAAVAVEAARASDAEATAAAAQQSAASANAAAADAAVRANVAQEQAAAVAAANATPPVTTVETTRQVIPAKPARRKIVRTKARPAVVKETTVVTKSE